MPPVRHGATGQNGPNAQLHVKLAVKEDIDSVLMVTLVILKVSHHSS